MKTLKKDWFLTILLSLFIFLSAISLTILLFFNQRYILFEYERLFEKQEDLSKKIEKSGLVMDFLEGKIEREKMFIEGFNQREIKHLEDVRNLMTGVTLLSKFFLGGTGVLLVIIWKNCSIIRKAFFLAGIQMAILTIFLLIFSIADFRIFFLNFHQLFFESGSWIFEEDDMLIQLYPEVFWMDTTKNILFLMLAESIIFLSVSFVLKKKFNVNIKKIKN